MRPFAFILVALLTAAAGAQLRPAEGKALDDTMTLANVRPSDLVVDAPGDAPAVLASALRDPVTAMVEAEGRHVAATPDEAALLRTALGLVGVSAGKAPKGETAVLPSTVPGGLQRPVGVLVAAIAQTDSEIRAALAPLNATERRILIEALPRLASEDGRTPLDYAHETLPDFGTVRKLLARVDVARIESAGVALARVVHDTLPELNAFRDKPLAKQLFRAQGVLVELSGGGADVHDRRDVGLCIDLGGDDRYTGRYAAGIGYASVLIDLDGNDRYGGPDANYGTGILGVGLVYDLAGEDVWRVRTAGLGCGLAGVGMAYDAAGDDRYRVVDLGLGAGYDGIGVFLDRLGDDAYEATRSGEGYGAARGVGWSLDGAGNDIYRGGRWVQATGRDGGIGLLTDLAGSDLYVCESGQAAALGGYASLGDLSGDDRYFAQSGAQGYARDGGFALLCDEEGDDTYLLREGAGQAYAFGGAAALWDRAGNDVYSGTDGAPAEARMGGIAVLLDGGGDDRYLSTRPASGTSDSISLWADAGGRDTYADSRTDGQAQASSGAAAYDVFGGAEPPAPTAAVPTPGSVPMPLPEEFADLRRRAAYGPDASEAMRRLVAIGVPALEALAKDPDRVFVGVASRLGEAAAPAVARLAHAKDNASIRAALATAGFVTVPEDAVIAALAEPDLAREAAVAAGQGRVKAAVPELSRLAAAHDITTARAATEALVQIGDPSAASTGQALLTAGDPRTRQAAFALTILQPTAALSAGNRLASSSDPFEKRIGLALLGAVGTPPALKTLGDALNGNRDAKIGALLALSGKVPAELLPQVEALRRDADPLVRAVAERTDAGP